MRIVRSAAHLNPQKQNKGLGNLTAVTVHAITRMILGEPCRAAEANGSYSKKSRPSDLLGKPNGCEPTGDGTTQLRNGNECLVIGASDSVVRSTDGRSKLSNKIFVHLLC